MNYTESHFLELQDHIAAGSRSALTAEQQAYEDLLFATIGIVRKEGRQAARQWLTADRGCTRHVAERIVGEAVNLFYQDDAIKREAWRNVLFQKLIDAARYWEQQHIFANADGDNAGDGDKAATGCDARAKDFEAYVKIIKQAAALKRLAEPDDDQQQRQPVSATQINIYGTNARDLGIPATDRQAIIQADYFKTLPRRHQERLAMEIGATPLDIDAMLDNSTELAAEVADT